MINFIPIPLKENEKEILENLAQHFESLNQKTISTRKVSKIIYQVIGYDTEILWQLADWFSHSGIDYLNISNVAKIIRNWKPLCEIE